MRRRLLLSAAAITAIACVVLLVLAMLPERPGVTKANFARIERGMTMEQVEQIMGGPASDEKTRPDRMHHPVYHAWRQNETGVLFYVAFDDGVVIGKDFLEREPESFFDKFRRWVGLP